MHLAFGVSSGFHPFRRFIAWVTDGPYCHVEFRFSDDTWYGYTPDYTGFHPEPFPGEFDVAPLDLTPAQEQALRQWCRDNAEPRYDYLGAPACCPWLPAWIRTRIFRPSESAWYCSENVIAGLQSLGLWRDVPTYGTSPNEVWRILRGG